MINKRNKGMDLNINDLNIDKVGKDTVIEANKKLTQKYPWLMPVSTWDGKTLDSYDYSYTLFDDIPFGWRKAFGVIMIEEIQKCLEEIGTVEKIDAVNSYSVLQIKEKFGSLRWYSNGDALISDTYDISNIERKYEVISEHVCINCGKLDIPIVNMKGYVSPYCPDCYYEIIKKLGINNSITDVVKFYRDIPDSEWIIPEEYTTTVYSEHGRHKLKYDISETVAKIRKYNAKFNS